MQIVGVGALDGIGVLGGTIVAAVIGLVILARAARGGAAPGPGRPAHD